MISKFRLSTTKPSHGTKLNRSSPFVRGLAGAFPFNEGAGLLYDHVTYKESTVSLPLPTWVPSQFGMSKFYASGTNQRDFLNHAKVSLSSFTVEVWCSINTSLTFTTDSPWGLGDGSNYLQYHVTSPANTAQWIFKYNGSVVGESTTSHPAGQVALMHIKYDGTTAWIYFNGKQIGGGGVTSSSTTFTQSVTGYAADNVSDNLNQSIYAIHIWNYPLTATQIQQRNRNIWSIYQPSAVPMFWMPTVVTPTHSRRPISGRVGTRTVM